MNQLAPLLGHPSRNLNAMFPVALGKVPARKHDNGKIRDVFFKLQSTVQSVHIRHYLGCTASQSPLVPPGYSGRVVNALPRVDFGSAAHLPTTYSMKSHPGDSHWAAPGDNSPHGKGSLSAASSSAPVVANHCPPLSEPTSHFNLPPHAVTGLLRP
ncbi:hypothetical protein F442_09355 [Phytophthora nicotianae P10297]|uniref:Uncharacterized protein n=1 Tax=Phytophthora nicotianae P10297 TaxID=1317064 RepID=W2Z9R7_PHYNI|nr:hypothetical protein F442_09355 [Phytophthora nicotianae P10297]